MTAEIINISDYLPILPPMEVDESEYSIFMDDLDQIGLKAGDFAQKLGMSRTTVYSWKQHGVPQYASVYLDTLMRLMDCEIRLNLRKAE